MRVPRCIARRNRPLWGAGLLLFLVATPSVAAPSTGTVTEPSPRSSPAENVHPYAGHVADASRRFGLPEGWIWAVMRVESGGNPRAISSAGAMGLMQIMPATWAALTARHRLGADPFDIRANIHAGAAYLRAMLDRYGDPALALAAYNAGPGRVDDWRANRRPLPAETIAYVAKIVPALGAAPAAASVMAAPSWREAALFPVRGTAPSEQLAGAVSPEIATGVRAPLPSPPQADGDRFTRPASLFVPLSGPRDQ